MFEVGKIICSKPGYVCADCNSLSDVSAHSYSMNHHTRGYCWPVLRKCCCGAVGDTRTAFCVFLLGIWACCLLYLPVFKF